MPVLQQGTEDDLAVALAILKGAGDSERITLFTEEQYERISICAPSEAESGLLTAICGNAGVNVSDVLDTAPVAETSDHCGAIAPTLTAVPAA